MSSRDRHSESSSASSARKSRSKWDQEPEDDDRNRSSHRERRTDGEPSRDRDRESERGADRDRDGGKERLSSSRDSRERDYERSQRDRRDRDDRERKSKVSSKDHTAYSSSRRRSHSPDFEADRRRERKRFEANSRSQSERNPNSTEWGGGSADQAHPQQEDEIDDEPDFGTSGLLAAASNSKNGVALKYHEPPEARLPKKKWRLYVFKGGKEIDLFHISRQSCYLFGRDRTVCDIPVDHPSLSKQHVVLQFRSIATTNEFGDTKRSTKPYLIDLESANGTDLNGKEIEASRYYELKNGDTFKLGASEREYVLLEEGKV